MAKPTVNKYSNQLRVGPVTREEEFRMRLRTAQNYATAQRRKYGHGKCSLPKITFPIEDDGDADANT